MTALMARRAAIIVALLLLVTLPYWVGGSYYINLASQILLFAVLALALNVLVGYGGLVSLGHAGLFAVAGYTAALMMENGYGHLVADLSALVVVIAASAVFGVLALRTTGIGFIMITLALGQIVWGIAYRWAGLTHGDNGVNVASRPEPFGISLSAATPFYFMTLAVFVVALATMIVFVRSPFGASLRGTRDQARRMNALGYNVWLIRFLAFLVSGFWSGVAGLLFIYYNAFISPQVAALQVSAEALLMVISGGTGTLLGPIAGATIVVIMKNVVFIDRCDAEGALFPVCEFVRQALSHWNMMLGLVFVAIVIFMPEGLVPGSVRLWKRAWQARRKPAPAAVEATEERAS
jgi:branched-chain amino acid transport system permease protein